MSTLTQIVTAVDAGTPTGFAGQYTSPGNIFVQDDLTPATAAGTVQNSLYGNHYALPSGWANGIPAGSTINSVTLNVRSSGGTNNRHTQGLRLDSVANTQIANELTATVAAGITTASFSAWSSLPTLAQLQSTNFRIRSRTARTVTQAATYSLYWIEVVVDYTPPAQNFSQPLTATASGSANIQKRTDKTLQAAASGAASVTRAIGKFLTSLVTGSTTLDATFISGSVTEYTYHVGFENPARPLVNGPDVQRFDVRFETAGTAKIYLYESGVEKALLFDSTVAADDVVGATWDSTGLDKNNIEAKIVGTAKVYSLEWDAVMTSVTFNEYVKTLVAFASGVPSVSRDVSVSRVATASVTATVRKAVSVTKTTSAAGTASIAASRILLQALVANAVGAASATRRTLKSVLASGTGSSTVTKQAGKSVLSAATGTPSVRSNVGKTVIAASTVSALINKQARKTLQAAASGTASVVGIKAFLLTLTATASGTPSLRKNVGKNLTSNVSVSPSMTRRVGKTLTAAASAIGTMSRRAGKTLLVTATGTPILNTLATRLYFAALTANATGAASVTKSISKYILSQSTAAGSMSRQTGKKVTADATATASTQNSISKTVTALVSVLGSIGKRIEKTLTAFSFVDTLINIIEGYIRPTVPSEFEFYTEQKTFAYALATEQKTFAFVVTKEENSIKYIIEMDNKPQFTYRVEGKPEIKVG